MISSFRHKGLKRFYEKDDRSKLPQDMLQRTSQDGQAHDIDLVGYH